MANDDPLARDAAMRQAGFDRIHTLQRRNPVLSEEDIGQGFEFAEPAAKTIFQAAFL